MLAPAPWCVATCGRATRVDIADVDGSGSDYMVVMAVAAAQLSVQHTTSSASLLGPRRDATKFSCTHQGDGFGLERL